MDRFSEPSLADEDDSGFCHNCGDADDDLEEVYVAGFMPRMWCAACRDETPLRESNIPPTNEPR